MTMLATQENGSEITQAADGRFFNTPLNPSDMFALSGAILADYARILNDGRGVLASVRENSNADNEDSDSLSLPTPPRTHSLEFDGSGGDNGQFGWRYTITDPAKGRTVKTMIVSADFWSVQETSYDQQGVLRDRKECADPISLSEQIGQMVSGEPFRNRANILLEKRLLAEADLAKLALALGDRNLHQNKIAKLLQKPRMGVMARSFVSCSPIR